MNPLIAWRLIGRKLGPFGRKLGPSAQSPMAKPARPASDEEASEEASEWGTPPAELAAMFRSAGVPETTIAREVQFAKERAIIGKRLIEEAKASAEKIIKMRDPDSYASAKPMSPSGDSRVIHRTKDPT